MLNFIDNFLNRITMYRLVLYYLVFLLAAAFGLSAIKILPFTPLALAFSTAVLIFFSWLANKVFARFLRVPTNVESVYITALILALIITPPSSTSLFSTLPFLFWASVLSQGSKYILNIRNKHIFNPAAFAVALTALALNQAASWWVGTSSMLIFVLAGGFLVIRKVQRFDAAISFVATTLVATIALSAGRANLAATLDKVLLYSPLFFFAAVMLTEPLTMPPTRDGRIAYGILTGWLFTPQVHLGPLYFSPELALLVGNLFSYAISPKHRLVLKLKEIKQAGTDIYDFIFQNDRPLKFRPGQYMEWTLGHGNSDNRGNRRYFTLASSPTEAALTLGVKFYGNSSSFKKKLLTMGPGDTIVASQLAGDFVLPSDLDKKIVFVAGGIGITPFRSMLKYLLDRNEKRPITVIYLSRTEGKIAYKDILDEAQRRLGIRTIYALTDLKRIPPNWQGHQGHLNKDVIVREIPDYKEHFFYISGSHTMVSAFKDILTGLGIPKRKIVTDFFPGLA